MTSGIPRRVLGAMASVMLASTAIGDRQLHNPLGPITDAATIASTVATAPVATPPPAKATSTWQRLGGKASGTDDPKFGSRAATSIRRTPDGYIQARVGCMEDSSAATMDRRFGRRIGPLIGWDNPHVIPLGGDRHLWLVHDAYLDYRFTATTLHEIGRQIQSMAIIQKGTCFTLVHRGTTERPLNFEPGNGAASPRRFFWPLGGELRNGVVKVFWAEMKRTDAGIQRGPNDGIIRHPVATWIGTYDPTTLERLSFRKAPTSSVKAPSPFSEFILQYGFAVESEGRHSYLFGNANLLNLALNGGYDNGPHPATRMYVGRVPKGRFAAQPVFRTRTGWSAKSRRAAVVSERFWTENTMQPRRFGKNRWVAVTKEDGFFGDELLIDVAKRPWGPWRTVNRFKYEPRHGSEFGSSYQPILLPQRDANGDLTVVIAQNAWIWEWALDSPRLYRPSALTVDWPFPD